ncbi:T-lymphocyte activation antigen CD80-like [Microcaecilia unicolor]|uniref:T-lymphocyte activation antigen CD80-like n=1 Tax=Microcaecilia unicolor TaxID=1415580 RepID=A0A6P7Y7D5_9AMPH|nr:T-lymphocyte activation antigen CD80-like [Microcaecilia unicolor]
MPHSQKAELKESFELLGSRRQLRQALRILGWMLAIIVWRNCFVPGLASPVPIWAVINSTAELPCSHNIGCVESLVNFRVYWQKNKTVLFELNEGKIELKHQNKAYVNRTTLHSNCSLLLFAIQVSDEGTYDCYLLKREGNEYKSPLHLSVALTVTAPFSQPIILKESSAKGTAVNLTCLSYGGYPKPTIVWYNVTGNATLNSSFSSTSFIQDPETRTYNMSSHLVMEITAPFSVACSVQSTYLPERNATIWIGKPPKIAKPKLKKSHEKGGIKFPDFFLYHIVFLLHYVMRQLEAGQDEPKLLAWLLLNKQKLAHFHWDYTGG